MTVFLMVAKSPGNLESWYKGFVFLTLEGLINVIIRSDVCQAYRGVLRDAPLIVVEGKVQQQERLLNVLAKRAGALSHDEMLFTSGERRTQIPT